MQFVPTLFHLSSRRSCVSTSRGDEKIQRAVFFCIFSLPLKVICAKDDLEAAPAFRCVCPRHFLPNCFHRLLLKTRENIPTIKRNAPHF